MRIQINCAGFKSVPTTMIAVLDEKTGVLVIAKEMPYSETKIKEDMALVSNMELTDTDYLFKDEHLRDAIRNYFEWQSSEMITIDELLARHQPDNQIEEDGVDERGRKFRLGGSVTNGQIAILAAVSFASKQRGIGAALNAMNELEEFYGIISI